MILCVCSTVICFAQSKVNSQANFEKFEELKKGLNCESTKDIDTLLLTTTEQWIEYFAYSEHQGSCLLQKRKIEESKLKFRELYNTAKHRSYHKIGRSALAKLSELYTFYKTDELPDVLTEMVEYDSLYNGKDKWLESLKNLMASYEHLDQFKESNKLADKIIGLNPDSSYIARAYLIKGLSNKNKVILADSFFRTALSFGPAYDSLPRSTMYKSYGTFLSHQGKKSESAEFYIQGINYIPADKMFDLSRCNSLSNLALLFIGLENYKRAREYLDQCLSIYKERNYKSINGFPSTVNAQLLLFENKLEEALVEVEKPIDYFKSRKSIKQLSLALSIKGLVYLKKNDIKSAVAVESELNDLLADQDPSTYSRRVNGFLSELAYIQKNYNQAEKIFKRILKNAKQSNDEREIYFAIDGLADTYDKKKQWKKALLYKDSLVELNKIIYENDQNIIINQLESEYNRKGQDQQIASLDKENKLKAQTVSLQRKAITGAGIALGMFALFSFFLYRLYKKVNSQKAIIEKALGEKDVLLREIHHRVKNNLQLVSSLLTIQSRDIQDEQALEALSVGKSRVKSMSLIHQDLYQKEKLTGINVKSYLEKLSSELFNTYNISEELIDLHLDIEDLDLDVDTIVPLGLIINELITNALKYAFPEGRSGNIFIAFKLEGNALKLTVKDDGIGIDNSVSTGTSFGNSLVKALTKQLDGKITLDVNQGTEIQLLFNDYKIAA